jgi:hypothetical protein
MRKKIRGHFCYVCGRTRPNEKFSGKGHSAHQCKDCKTEGKELVNHSTGDYDRKVSYLLKAVKNCLVLYTDKETFFIFEFQGHRYVAREDFEAGIFVYKPNSTQKFLVLKSSQLEEPLLEVLYIKFYHTLEAELSYDYEDFIFENEFIELSKKRKQHLEVILSIRQLISIL